jgi:porin
LLDRIWSRFLAVAAAAILLIPISFPSGHALEITDKLRIGGILAGAYQYQEVNDAPGFENTGRGAVTFQPEVSFKMTAQDEIFTKFGFAAGNALNDDTSPFVLAPWAANLEDDVKNINGRDRDTLLTVWYKHIFKLSDDHTLGLTGGIIDSTDYLGENAYANDEYTQFMNEVFTNAANVFYPSYDIGGALEWQIKNFSVKGVIMNVGEDNEAFNNFNFAAFQIGYRLNTALGQGNYRIIVAGTSVDFPDPQGTKQEARGAIEFSFDQRLGETLGVWIRLGQQKDDAAVNFSNLYSGGIDIKGQIWGRKQDNIGLAYALLDGGNLYLDKTQAFEAYIRFVLNAYFAATADLQYLKDEYKNADSPEGWIYGVRLTVSF